MICEQTNCPIWLVPFKEFIRILLSCVHIVTLTVNEGFSFVFPIMRKRDIISSGRSSDFNSINSPPLTVVLCCLLLHFSTWYLVLLNLNFGPSFLCQLDVPLPLLFLPFQVLMLVPWWAFFFPVFSRRTSDGRQLSTSMVTDETLMPASLHFLTYNVS